MTTSNQLDQIAIIVNGWDEYGYPQEYDHSDKTREITIEELQKVYKLDREHAHLLWFIIKEQQDSRYNLYALEDKKAECLLEVVQESIHMSHDGWSETEKVVIRAYLADLSEAANLTWDDYQKRKSIK